MKELDRRALITVTGGSDDPRVRAAASQQFTSALQSMASFWQQQPLNSGRKF